MVQKLQDRGLQVDDTGMEQPIVDIGVCEEALEEEDDPNIPPEEASQIRQAKEQSVLDKNVRPYIDIDSSISATAKPATPPVVSGIIEPYND
ncbi:hypothetical protein HAX54_050477 [Datura stramonium]|uniref:Uncharacterized protein n=1 Tax=Datura stramonium TaxID=4076 RepID=A0ABS8SWI0_DATST|nr:hypothetical protein [Datura stramonium]